MSPTTPPPAATGPGAAPRFAYVLLCHTDPATVLDRVRRVRALSPGGRVLVRTSDPRLFRPGQVQAAGGELLVSTTRVRWGSWSVVAAAVEALEEARHRFAPTHVVLVSGQDHPVRDLAAWEAEVVATGADAFLTSDAADRGERHRRCWHELPEAPTAAAPSARALRLLARAPGGEVGVVHAGGRTWFAHHPAASPPPLPYRKGSLWMTLSAAALDRVLAAADDPVLTGWFSRTLLPDESFVHSVLHAEGSLRVLVRPTTMAVWPLDDPGHPRVLVADDAAAALGCGTPFARKVVPGRSDTFTALVDAAVDAAVARRRAATTAGPLRR